MEHSVSQVYTLAGCTVLDVVLSDTTNMSRGKRVNEAVAAVVLKAAAGNPGASEEETKLAVLPELTAIANELNNWRRERSE
jgi:hypothetical protein